MRSSFFKSFLIFFCSLFATYGFASVDLVIFSYDRPLQLYALLESCQERLTGLESTHVIYRASSEEYATAYLEVQAQFPKAHMHRQGTNPHSDFQPLLLSSVYASQSSAQYVLFAVDDMIVTQSVNLLDCVKMLEKTQAWGFFLRLGKNISHTYTTNTISPAPTGKKYKNCFLWKFTKGKGYWNYPNTVDMTIYRKSDIKTFLTKGAYKHPNSLEEVWQQYRPPATARGICYNHSQVINIPLNIINPSANRHMNLYTVEELLRLFQKGMKIDITAFTGCSFNSCHVAVEPSFVHR